MEFNISHIDKLKHSLHSRATRFFPSADWLGVAFVSLVGGVGLDIPRR